MVFVLLPFCSTLKTSAGKFSALFSGVAVLKKGTFVGCPFLWVFGGVLLFHPGWVVSSALAGLASGFGMGPGVSLSLWPP